jgi:hypothetical protein
VRAKVSMAKASPPRPVASAELVTAVSEVDMTNYWMLRRSGAINRSRARLASGIQRNNMHPPTFFA